MDDDLRLKKMFFETQYVNRNLFNIKKKYQLYKIDM